MATSIITMIAGTSTPVGLVTSVATKAGSPFFTRTTCRSAWTPGTRRSIRATATKSSTGLRSKKRAATAGISACALPVKDGAGTIVRRIGTCTDIDDQKRAEAKLLRAREELEERVQQRTAELWQATEGFRRNEQRYRSLVEATTAVVWGMAANGEVESDLPGWAAFTGQSLQQIRGRGWLDAVHPEDRAKTILAWSAAFATRSLYQMEHRVRRHDGEYRNMQARAVPIMDDQGTIREWVGAHVDVTEQKRAEEVLAESERFARSTLDALSAHIAILDDKGLILATNSAWRDFAIANSARTEVGVGANYLDACDIAAGPCAEDAAAVAAGIREVIRDERGDFALEYPCHSPSEKRWFLALRHAIRGRRPGPRGHVP